MGLEEQLLTASIAETFSKAHDAQVKLHYITEGNTLDNVDEGSHANALNEALEVMAFYVDKAFRDTMILAERLGLPALRRDISKSRAAISDLSALVPTPYDVLLHSEPLAEAAKYFDSLECMTRGRAITGLGAFETVLQNTAKIIEARGVLPRNEAEVREAVRETLSFCFRDVVREIPLARMFKVYRPDIGVTSLMAAAEYKFIDSKTEAKKSLDEIYADMKGYSGRYEWRSFFAVFYLTAPFYSQKDVDEEFRLVKAELSWTPIVVIGRGGRATRG